MIVRCQHAIVATAVAAVLLMTACDGGTTPPATSAPAGSEAQPPSTMLEPAGQGGDDGLTELISNDETYLIRYRFVPETIPLNEPFGIEAWIVDRADPDRRIDDVVLDVDGRMPNHRHGMNREPTIDRTEDGVFAVDGMLFHMPGFWEVHFDVTRGAVTERAQLEVELR